ncbi:hypothetical protein MNBD_BACTEROID06-894, partial [hydrothermal vent metagenome]
TNTGMFTSIGVLFIWTAIPVYFIKRISAKKDF